MIIKYVLPTLVGLIILYSAIKKVKIYDCFVDGATESIALIKAVFPYVTAVFICIALFKESGLSDFITKILAVPLGYLGIPSELSELILLTPLSGNGTLALIEEIIKTYGADSYVARCACVISGATETVFYISAVYLSKCKSKKITYAIGVALFSTFIGAITACLICKVI